MLGKVAVVIGRVSESWEGLLSLSGRFPNVGRPRFLRRHDFPTLGFVFSATSALFFLGERSALALILDVESVELLRLPGGPFAVNHFGKLAKLSHGVEL